MNILIRPFPMRSGIFAANNANGQKVLVENEIRQGVDVIV